MHDMGKLGIPDSILHKPDELTDEEWQVMRQHPQLAYDMLNFIGYLRPALDIPYSHHEKWDGSGYPRGFKGEAIPLAARIFAIVDVWDALTSERPYRPAWKDEEALAYIREQSGKHFQPRIVELFFKIVERGLMLLPCSDNFRGGSNGSTLAWHMKTLAEKTTLAQSKGRLHLGLARCRDRQALVNQPELADFGTL